MILHKAFAAALTAAVIGSSVIIPVSAVDTKLPAFPGVEGGGKFTTGARGAEKIEVYHVSNLNDDGEGSLRDAISKPGRIIVFDVGGVIELKTRLDFTEDNITVLGQTAPGDGITITGYDSVIKANNIILRYLRIRPTDIQNGEPDALGGRWIHNIVLDHCSVSWGVDEMLTLYSGSLEGGKTPSENISVQYCLSSESLRMSSHIKGAHGYGGIVGGTDATWHHNMFAHNDSRNPRFDRNLKNTDFVNNVIYNWGNNIMYGAEPYSYNKQEEYSNPEHVSNINIRNNYIKYGPSTKPETRSKIFEATNDGKVIYNGEMLKSNAYINGNFVYGNQIASENNAVSEETVKNRNLLNLLDTPVSMGDYEINIQTAEQAYDDVIANVGATLPKRDATDARVVMDAVRGTGRIINQDEEVGSFVSFSSAERVFEIPAEWKNEHGMGEDNDADFAPSGYTWIEEYVNDWTAAQSVPSNPKITVLSPETASIDKTVDKTGKGFWLVADTDDTVKYSAEVSTANNEAPASVVLYDGNEMLTALDGDGLVYSTDIYLDTGTHYLTTVAEDTIGQKTTSDTAIVYITDGEPMEEIGDSPYLGMSRVWNKNGVKYISGSGCIGGTNDIFSYDYKTKKGDFSYTVKINEIPKYENGPLAGIMIRNSLDADSEMVMLSDTWKKYGENIIIPRRLTKGGKAETIYLNDVEGKAISNAGSYDTVKYPMPKYLRVERKGNELILSVSDSGINWTDNARQPMKLDISGWNDELFVGLACDSRNELTNEASPLLPWFTIAGFTEMKQIPIVVTAKYDDNLKLIATETANEAAITTENTKVFVF